MSGPPGTGKTTLLQTIVANLYVKHALNEDRAPIMIATSTNNQAVTNIIDSFGKIKAIGIKNLESRWIKGVNSFAVYFPSRDRQREANEKGYQFTSIFADNFAEKVDTEENIHDSKEHLIQECELYFDRTFTSAQQCERCLHDELLSLNRTLESCVGDFEALVRLSKGQAYTERVRALGEEIELLQNHKEAFGVHKTHLHKAAKDIQARVAEWLLEYKLYPWHIKLFKFLPAVQSKLRSRLIFFMTPEESEVLPASISLEGILEYYATIKEQLDSKISLAQKNSSEIDRKIGSISRELKQLHTLRKQCVERISTLHRYNPNITESTLETLNEFDHETANELLDSSLRYAMFWLAVHYYESRWVQGEDALTGNQRGKTFETVVDKFYHRLAMVTPCMVSTCFMLPKQFLAYDGNSKKRFYLYNYADLLIIDEAGQISPEKAAPVFSLAKRAVVVGDENQIDPVWETSRALDIALAKESLVLRHTSYEALVDRGLCCADSSVMKAASNSCKYAKYEKGLFLSEHRRCYDEIIEYSNRLVYQNKLVPMRGKGADDARYPLPGIPFMGHRDIPTEKSQRMGTSRANVKESKQIIEWVSENYEMLVAAYKDSCEEDVLGIITPFKAQASMLKKLLRETNRDFARTISVGTVHTFQGAERRIIIFSSVYGSEDGCYFIDKNKKLMNVAVSRAKDAFLVFGARGCLKSNLDSASGLLRYLTEHVL